MKNKLSFTLLFLISMSANAEEKKILECNGFSEDEGINIPKIDKPIIRKKEKVYEQFIVNENSITIVSGTYNIKDENFQLCEKTTNAYVYALDCAIAEPRKMAIDWTQEKNANSQGSEFYKKWLPTKKSYFGARLIYLDRVNLTITDDDYQLNTKYIKDKKSILDLQNYAIINHTNYQCRIAKSKI